MAPWLLGKVLCICSGVALVFVVSFFAFYDKVNTHTHT